ncbi:MAG: hypothetical protein KVP17_000804 [Porospora cf. gigantea B]|uniref:uncharacterized protein n=1 Tax=Porospora cf. gigantea B TaxID=2853592 RepID=UPI003571F274|nr:MAG: hypothetical protein KVP17_000804 [Porospora cf. gigantea B]
MYVLGSLAQCAAITATLQAVSFVVSVTCRTDKLFDMAGVINYILLDAITYMRSQRTERQALISACVAVWGFRFAVYLALRARHIKQDHRFDPTRHNKRVLFMIFAFQGLCVFQGMLPVILANNYLEKLPNLICSDMVGLTVFLFGFCLQFVADIQKGMTHQDGWFVSRGVWSWSRHPNYFGEIMVWVGIYVMVANGLDKCRWVAATGPAWTTVNVVLLSGVRLMEKYHDEAFGKTKEYGLYRDRTSILIPLPTWLYSRLPRVMKVLLLDWPLFDYRKDHVD